jgi:hypothetical protein
MQSVQFNEHITVTARSSANRINKILSHWLQDVPNTTSWIVKMLKIILLHLYGPVAKMLQIIQLHLYKPVVKMLQIIQLHLYEPILSKHCKSYSCTCMNPFFQNVVNQKATPVRTCSDKMLQIILLHLLEPVTCSVTTLQIIQLHLYEPILSKCCKSYCRTC